MTIDSRINGLYEQIRRCAFEAQQIKEKTIGSRKTRCEVATLLLYHAAQALKDPKIE